MNKINKFIKRAFDFVSSFLGIIVLSPVLLIICISIKVTSPGPILFKQKRVGINGKCFNILKFRTMVVDAEKMGKQITVGADKRITSAGKFLRKYKLDELPQLFKVPRYVELYNEEQRKVLKVRPGITDLASLRYRDENDILGEVNNPEEYYINTIMPDKLSLNLEYINNNNFFYDIGIIFKTIIKCLK